MVVVALFLGSPAAAQTAKSGGVINLMQREELAVDFAIVRRASWIGRGFSGKADPLG